MRNRRQEEWVFTPRLHWTRTYPVTLKVLIYHVSRSVWWRVEVRVLILLELHFVKADTTSEPEVRTFDECPSAYKCVVFQTYIRDKSSKWKQVWSAIKCCTLTGWMFEFGYPTLVKPLSPSAGLSLRASATQNYRSRLKIYLRRIRRGVEMSMWVRGKNPLLLPVTFPSASAWSWQWLAGETGRRHTLRTTREVCKVHVELTGLFTVR